MFLSDRKDMQLAKEVRESLAENPYKFCKRLGMTLPAYQELEKRGKRISLRRHVALADAAIESGLCRNDAEYMALVRHHAITEPDDYKPRSKKSKKVRK